MPSHRARSRGLRETHEMQNVNQPGGSNVRFEHGINRQPSPSRQISSNQSSFRNQQRCSERATVNFCESSNEDGHRKTRTDYEHHRYCDLSNPFDSCYYQELHMQFGDEYSDGSRREYISDDYELINRQHRTTSIHRNAAPREIGESPSSRTLPRTLENRRQWMSPAGQTMKRTSLEQRANNIANQMEKDCTLMEDSPTSEVLRREALRDMPQCLTVKRIIKRKLNTSVNKHAKHRPIGFYRGIKYNVGKETSKLHNSLKSLIYSFELWYSSLKTIEGHFGSGVATYFKFFRWLFIMNCLITFFTFAFVVLPQLLYSNISSATEANRSSLAIYDSFVGNVNSIIVPEALKWSDLKVKKSSENNATFKFSNIFTGDGYFTNTTLYYGFYTNNRIHILPNQKYSMPYAYFFTMLSMYVISFVVLSISMARSYRRSFIETQGGLKNVYAHKIFCGWDYSIATKEAAHLKASSIYHELKELLSDSVQNDKEVSCLQKFWTYVIQFVCNLAILCQLVGTGYTMWILLERNSNDGNNNNPPLNVSMISAAVINVIMLLFPSIFSFIARYEDYKHPRAALYITLIRTFLLKTVVIGVFLAFWLTHYENEKCWETSIGQHIYRLIMFDFFFAVLLTALLAVIRNLIYKKWKKIGMPEFDIAKYTLQLMYNQTLFWVGFYFSPLLSLVVVIKLWCTWYIRRTCVLHLCKPSSKSWRAAQTHTWFLILSFLSLLLVIITLGYIIVDMPTSSCGPFRDYLYVYEIILKGLFQLEQNNVFWKMLMYLTKPGTIALILVAMCVIVYYLRAKAIAQKGMVQLLRDMLLLEAKDKEFLLENISKVTEGQWQYNLQDQTQEMWNSVDNACNSSRAIKTKEDGDRDESSSGSDTPQNHHSSSRYEGGSTSPCKICKMLTINHKRERVNTLKHNLEVFTRNLDEFLRRFITVETWTHHYESETKFVKVIFTIFAQTYQITLMLICSYLMIVLIPITII